MMLSMIFSQADLTLRRIHAPAKMHIKKSYERVRIMHADLDTEAGIPNINARQFQEQAETAKSGCLLCQLLTGTKVALNAMGTGRF